MPRSPPSQLRRAAGWSWCPPSSRIAFAKAELFPASAAAKAALEALAKSLAVELSSTRTTVNIVVPGFTRKDEGKLGALPRSAWDEVAKRNPQGRLALPDEVAATIAFLLSDEAAHITGATIPCRWRPHARVRRAGGAYSHDAGAWIRGLVLGTGPRTRRTIGWIGGRPL